MDNGTHMNYLALNQNILFKPLRIGAGPVEGTQLEPIISSIDIPIYLNGKHNFSEIFSGNIHLTELSNLGQITHPNAMTGMPGQIGELTYDLGISDDYHIIIVRLKLDESTNGKSTEASEILSIVKNSDIPESFFEQWMYKLEIARSLLYPHFKELFEFYESYSSLIDSDFIVESESALEEIIREFFEDRE